MFYNEHHHQRSHSNPCRIDAHVQQLARPIRNEVLMDLIQVLHPEIAEKISPGRDLKYYIKLSD